MKRLMILMVVMTLMTGCAWWSKVTVPDTVTAQAAAYASGKGVGAAVNEFAPQADEPLGIAWEDMMTGNQGADPVPGESIVAFYQEAILILGKYTKKDPYGLVSDLAMLISIFGGSMDSQGNLIIAKPIPLKVMMTFELGYKSGKAAVRNYAPITSGS